MTVLLSTTCPRPGRTPNGTSSLPVGMIPTLNGIDLQFHDPVGCKGADIKSPDLMTFRENKPAFPDIFTCRAHMLPRRCGFPDLELVLHFPGVFDHDHGIEPRGDDIPGIDPGKIIKSNRSLIGSTKGIPAFYCYAVHSCQTYFRHGVPGINRFGDDPAQRPGNVNESVRSGMANDVLRRCSA